MTWKTDHKSICYINLWFFKRNVLSSQTKQIKPF